MPKVTYTIKKAMRQKADLDWDLLAEAQEEMDQEKRKEEHDAVVRPTPAVDGKDR